MFIWLGVPALRLQAVFRGAAGVIGQGLDADHIAVDLGGDVELLLYRLGNLAAAGGKLIVKPYAQCIPLGHCYVRTTCLAKAANRSIFNGSLYIFSNSLNVGWSCCCK